MTMIATLSTFSRALLAPDLALKSLTALKPVCTADGMPRLMRTTRFAEAEILWASRRWLLSLPLTPAALPRIERTASALRRIDAPWLAEYRILPDELRWADATGCRHTASLVLQELPAGCSLAEAQAEVSADQLIAALDTLEAALRASGLAHNNLKAENLRWTGERLVPLRYHDATTGGPYEADAAAFEALRRSLGATATAQGAHRQEVHDTTATYAASPKWNGHRWVSHLFEGLVCVEDEAGYGYVDAENRPVIPAQFRWAGDFREGRAEVETPTGMGLIDRTGRFVIPPAFEIVDYDPARSVARVRSEGRWALYDYLGNRLTEFEEEEAPDKRFDNRQNNRI